MPVKGIAIILVGNFAAALEAGSVEAAESDLHWLRPDQYRERDGGVEFARETFGEVISYAEQNGLFPLGFVIVYQDGKRRGFFNDAAFFPDHRAFAEKMFRVHQRFWFDVIPRLTVMVPNA